MPWPPQKGELLPRYKEPADIERKLREYVLALDHEVGASKANGFKTMLGIDLETADNLEGQIRAGIAVTPISSVRLYGPDAAGCAVDFRIAGIGRYSQRRVWIRTAWYLAGPGAPPRFSTAIPLGRKKR